MLLFFHWAGSSDLMKITKLNLYKYSLPLAKPLEMKGSIQTFREGLIIELMDENGHCGFGDAAPFPGLHKETLKDIIAEISDQINEILVFRYDPLIDIFSNLKPLLKNLPSLNFAMEWAIVDLIAKSKNIVAAKLFNSNPKFTIPLNALLTGNSKGVLAQAETLKSKKYKAIKLKVATRPLDEEINLVLKLNDIFEGNMALRLDANQTWSREQATTFGKAVHAANIEYIEEPFSRPDLFAGFFYETGLQYAFDETLSQNIFKEIKSFAGLDAIVLKPSVIGRLSETQNWVKWAEQKKVKTVFSSVFESGIGLRAIANLTAAWGEKNAVHGLDTFSWFKEDVTDPAFTSNGASLHLADQDFKLNYKTLKKIYEQNF